MQVSAEIRWFWNNSPPVLLVLLGLFLPRSLLVQQANPSLPRFAQANPQASYARP